MDEAVASRCRPPPVSLVVVVLVVFGLLPAGSVGATSQGPVADGPYVGTLPCADCAGIRTTLTLHSMGEVLRAPPIPLSWRWRGGRAERAEALLSVSTERTALEVSLRPRICHDAETGAVHGFVASVTVHRPEPMVEYRGCAHLGTEPLY